MSSVNEVDAATKANPQLVTNEEVAKYIPPPGKSFLFHPADGETGVVQVSASPDHVGYFFVHRKTMGGFLEGTVKPMVPQAAAFVAKRWAGDAQAILVDAGQEIPFATMFVERR